MASTPRLWSARCRLWRMDDRSLYSYSTTSPAPSKNFIQVYVTDSEVIFRTWKILPPTRPDSSQAPTQVTCTYNEFFYDEKTRGEIERGMGIKELVYVDRLLSGHIDCFNRLSSKLTMTILSYLDLLSLIKLGMVNKYFYEICASNELWANIYLEYNKTPVTQELLMLVDEKGWKTVFFMNKLQLQMQIRRHTGKEESPIFLTSQEEEEEEEEETPAVVAEQQTLEVQRVNTTKRDSDEYDYDSGESHDSGDEA